MNNDSETELTYVKCAELVRALVFAARGNHAMSTRLPMEVLTMHHLNGRLVFAVHAITYNTITNMAQRRALDIQPEQLWSDIARARSAIAKAVEALPSICPRTRRPALLHAVMLNPILKRSDVAAQAKVSNETAGRWLEMLKKRGLMRRIDAGNTSTYFVAPLVIAVIRQLHLLEQRAVDSNTLRSVFEQPVVIAMEPYQSGYVSTGDRVVRHRTS